LQHVYDFLFFSKNRQFFIIFHIFTFFSQKTAKKKKTEKHDLKKHFLK